MNIVEIAGVVEEELKKGAAKLGGPSPHNASRDPTLFSPRIRTERRVLRCFTRPAYHFHRHCRWQIYPTHLEYIRPRREQNERRDRSHCDEKGFHGQDRLTLGRNFPHRYNFRLFAADDAGDMIGPNGQGVFHFALIWTAIVSAGDASLVTTDVVQYRLDDMRLHTDVGHSSRRSPAQIVHRPSGRLGAPIKRLLAR